MRDRGGYLVWLWLRDGMSWILGMLEAYVLFSYMVWFRHFSHHTFTTSMQRMAAYLFSDGCIRGRIFDGIAPNRDLTL